MSTLEITAAVFGAASVFLMAKESLWAWPVGLVNVVLYTFVFQGARLYAQMGLQIVYAVLMVIGFLAWRRGESGAPLVPSFTPPARLAGFLGLGGGNVRHRRAPLPRAHDERRAALVDGGTSAFSLVAQYLPDAEAHRAGSCGSSWTSSASGSSLPEAHRHRRALTRLHASSPRWPPRLAALVQARRERARSGSS
jgi:hypothetical protein